MQIRALQMVIVIVGSTAVSGCQHEDRSPWLGYELSKSDSLLGYSGVDGATYADCESDNRIRAERDLSFPPTVRAEQSMTIGCVYLDHSSALLTYVVNWYYGTPIKCVTRIHHTSEASLALVGSKERDDGWHCEYFANWSKERVEKLAQISASVARARIELEKECAIRYPSPAGSYSIEYIECVYYKKR